MKKIIFLLLLLTLSCSKTEQTTNSQSDEKLVTGIKVYKEFITLKYQDSLNTPTSVLLDTALQHQAMSIDEFTQALEHFKNHPAEFNEELTGINQYINALLEKSDQQ